MVPELESISDGVKIQVVTKIDFQEVCVCAQSLNCVQLFVTPWAVGCQAPLSVEFSRQKYYVANDVSVHQIISETGSQMPF